MRTTQRSLQLVGESSLLLSIKPKYCDLILSGLKTVEFRRSWAARPVGSIAIYASSPIKRIVGIALVHDVLETDLKELWKMCLARGGGLDRQAFNSYYFGKTTGFAVLLSKVIRLTTPVSPTRIFADFSAPQSFRYISEGELRRVRSQGATA